MVFPLWEVSVFRRSNDLTELDADIFDGLTALDDAGFRSNDLTDAGRGHIRWSFRSDRAEFEVQRLNDAGPLEYLAVLPT